MPWMPLFAGLVAGALWGLTFLAPLWVLPFGAGALAGARYAVFGAVGAVVLVLTRRAAVRRMSRRDWGRALTLGFAGYALYYVLCALAVTRAGAALTALLIGILPLSMAVIGGWGRPGFRLHRLLPAALLILGGLVALKGADLWYGTGVGPDLWQGVALALAAMACWTWYGLANARFLAHHPRAPDNLTWTALTGIGSCVTMLPLLALDAALGGPDGVVDAAAWGRLALVGLVTGVLGSWGATWAWSYASRHLPPGWLGPLLVFETLFGTFYAFLWEERWPNPGEALAVPMLCLGVLAGLRAAASGRDRPGAA